MKKRIWYLCLLSLLSVFLLAACGKKEEEEFNPNYDYNSYLTGTHYAIIDVRDYGQIYVELYADKAPGTVTNFVNLANEGFYDGLTFHRIITGFMIQGGDPEGNGTGGSKYTIPGEFALNDFDNSISHVRGTISMARSEEYDSASSQFFIVHEDSTALDGSYAAFGSVVSGMEVVDDICADITVEDNNGTVRKENQPVINSIKIVEESEFITDSSSKNPLEQLENEKNERPEAKAVIELLKVNNPEDINVEDRWVVNEDADVYFLTSSEDLLSLGLYETDITQGLPYDTEHPIAYSSDIGANTYLAIQITLSNDGLPEQLLVAEEHSGALSMYLLDYNKSKDLLYLVPVLD